MLSLRILSYAYMILSAFFQGFMNEDEYKNVVEKMRLKNGLLFGLPVVLDTDRKELTPGTKAKSHTNCRRCMGTYDKDESTSRSYTSHVHCGPANSSVTTEKTIPWPALQHGEFVRIPTYVTNDFVQQRSSCLLVS